jgi:hypothetical protein
MKVRLAEGQLGFIVTGRSVNKKRAATVIPRFPGTAAKLPSWRALALPNSAYKVPARRLGAASAREAVCDGCTIV